jgi:hypothetical protein
MIIPPVLLSRFQNTDIVTAIHIRRRPFGAKSIYDPDEDFQGRPGNYCSEGLFAEKCGRALAGGKEQSGIF